MKRLFIIVEGFSEEAFVKDVLAPHLHEFEIPQATPIIVTTSQDPGTGAKRKGGGQWKHWRKDIHKTLTQNPGNEVRVTTLFDLYGLPKDFPNLTTHNAVADTVQRADLLQDEMASAFNDWRLIPYIQRHEFEALVLAALDVLEDWLETDEDIQGLVALRNTIQGWSPEDINDGAQTAPSKRLESHIPGYQKALHGPFATENAGLSHIREACPRFSGWLTQLEAFGHPSSP